MSASDPGAAYKSLVGKCKGHPAPPLPDRTPPEADPVLAQLVYSYLLWEAGPVHAASSLDRVVDAAVDCNELRICTTDELASMISARHPRAIERCERLRSTLGGIYEREHKLTLDHLCTMPKREAWTYLTSLDGIPRFVAARVVLLSLGGHRFPVDSRIARVLDDAGLCGPGRDESTLAGEVERALRAGEASGVYLALETMASTIPRRRQTPKKSATASDHGSRSSRSSTKE